MKNIQYLHFSICSFLFGCLIVVFLSFALYHSYFTHYVCVRAGVRSCVRVCVCVCDKHMLMEVRRLLRWVRECSLSTMSPQEWTPVIRFTKQSISTCLPISLALIYFVCLFACFGLGWDFLCFVWEGVLLYRLNWPSTHCITHNSFLYFPNAWTIGMRQHAPHFTQLFLPLFLFIQVTLWLLLLTTLQ